MRAAPFVLTVLALLAATTRASAVLTEPDGRSVPIAATQESNQYGNVLLSALFQMRGEAVDWLNDAQTAPAAFSPLCGFTGQLVLRGGGCRVDLGWYNADSSSSSPPLDSEIYTLVPGASLVGEFSPKVGDPAQQTFSAASIRSDARYKGGLIGFALRGDNSTACSQTHFSEERLNPICTNCTPPAAWITTIIYQSTATPDAYYIAFEDLPMSPTSFAGFPGQQYTNDGDFNDFVYFLTGLTCDGGGEPCATGQPGVCAAGITDCVGSGTVSCRPENQASPEKCNALDDDCNGSVDEGDLCAAGQVCDRGTCVESCASGEFPCSAQTVCQDGFCVDPACQGKTCATGQVCRAGVCVGPCDGVVCPKGQVCRLDRCVDPCAGVTCPEGRSCNSGVCVTSCACHGSCAAGGQCDVSSGRCVESGCVGKTCAAGEACVGGACANACDGAVCPGGAACNAGVCADPVGSGGTSSGTGGTGGIVVGTGGSAASSWGGAGSGGTPAADAAAGAGAAHRKEASAQPGCACRLSSGSAESAGAGAGLLLMLAAARRRQRRAAGARGRG